MNNICRNCDFFKGSNLTELGVCEKYQLYRKHELSNSCSQFIDEKKKGIQKLKALYEKYSDEDIVLATLDAAHKMFNEKDFTYYDYSLRIAYEISMQVKDGLLTKSRADNIHKMVANKINEIINEVMENRCDKCCR